jgi:endonuclease YncB( thermonuclease family)
MKRPQLSFAKVLWPLDPPIELVRVTVARHHVADAHAAADAIAADGSFLPARAWLVQDDAEPGDPDAVSVYFPTARGAYRAGAIVGRKGRVIRLQMNAIGRPGEPLETLACVVGGAQAARPVVRVYLPVDLDELVAAGYDRDPANRPAWLADTTPVAPRAVASDDGREFTLDELRKVCCRFAKSRRLPSLPDNIEHAVKVGTAHHGSILRQTMRALATGAAFMVMAAAMLAAIPATAAEPLTGKVVSVTDGDTVRVLDAANVQHKVRLDGIDAPERGQPFGTVARDRLAALVMGKAVTVHDDGRDKYGRTLGRIEVEGQNVNRQMVDDGMAWHYSRFNNDARLAAAERAARAAKRGLWADAKPVPPWEWRATAKDRKGQPVTRNRVQPTTK